MRRIIYHRWCWSFGLSTGMQEPSWNFTCYTSLSSFGFVHYPNSKGHTVVIVVSKQGHARSTGLEYGAIGRLRF